MPLRKWTLLLCAIGLLSSIDVQAQTPYPMRWSFRLYDGDQQLITPYRFVREVELYSLYSYPPFIYRKKLIFDDRTYYFLYEEDKFPEFDMFVLIHQQDTMYLEFNHVSGIMIMDSLTIRHGYYSLTKTAFEKVEGNISPFLKEDLYLLKPVNWKDYQKHTNPLPNEEARELFSEKVRVDLPNREDILHGK